MNKIVAVHQPNFFPWLGYFDKIARADTFVFLDSVQFSRGSWSNRVKVKIGDEAKWITGSLKNFSGKSKINNIEFSSDNSWQVKISKQIKENYSRHPFFSEVFDEILELVFNKTKSLSDYNINSVIQLYTKLGLDEKKFLKSSELGVEGSSNELLCSITNACGCQTYLCGGGADEYFQEEIFFKQGLIVKYQNFNHPVYTQFGSSIITPGLSIIDALMNLGWHGTALLLQDPGK